MTTTMRNAFVFRALAACASVSCSWLAFASCAPPITSSEDVVLVAPDAPAAAPARVEEREVPSAPGVTVDDLAPLPDACANDVPTLFGALAAEPRGTFAVQNDGALPFPRYTDAAENRFGLGEHFQGVQRVGSHLFLTGGVVNGPHMAQLIVLDTNVPDTNAPTEAAGVVRAHDLDAVLWHAGGFQISDGIAAIALAGDDDDAGEVRFYDVASSLDPDGNGNGDGDLREMDVRITRDHKLYAAAISRDADGRFVVVTWDDDRIEVHRSLGARLEDGLASSSALIDPADVDDFQGGGCGLGCGTYQSINVVRECGSDALFVVATRNTNKLAPAIDGDDLASLYSLTLTLDGDGAPTAASIALVERRAFTCADRQCNFAAAAGAFVVDENRLALYGAYHWLQDDRVLLNEFTSP